MAWRYDVPFPGWPLPYGRPYPYAGINYVLRQFAQNQHFHYRREAYRSGTFYLQRAAQDALANMNEATAQQVVVFIRAFEQRSRYSRTETQRAHHALAKLMQVNVVRAYEQARQQFGRPTPSYRQGGPANSAQRDAGGRMLQALQSEELFRATYDGILFGNTAFLDRSARQWHRLNFGARPAGQYTPRMYPVRFSNLAIGSFGFAGESPSDPFVIPAGWWFGGGPPTGRFYPYSRSGWWGENTENESGAPTSYVPPYGRWTKGIRAWKFLDAAPRTLAENLGTVYENLYEVWFNQASRGRGPVSRVTKTPPRPRAGAFLPK